MLSASNSVAAGSFGDGNGPRDALRRNTEDAANTFNFDDLGRLSSVSQTPCNEYELSPAARERRFFPDALCEHRDLARRAGLFDAHLLADGVTASRPLSAMTATAASAANYPAGGTRSPSLTCHLRRGLGADGPDVSERFAKRLGRLPLGLQRRRAGCRHVFANDSSATTPSSVYHGDLGRDNVYL